MFFYIVGVKFKLVKSNSCASRLELIGANNHLKKCTDTAPLDNIDNDDNPSSSSSNRSHSPDELAEESVRNLINRLETGAVNQSNAPKIIESKCIEKFTDINCQLNPVTINNQLIAAKAEELIKVGEIITQVTVNNHLNFGELSNAKSIKMTAKTSSEIGTKPIITKAITKSAKDNENIVKQSQEKTIQTNKTTHHHQTFEEAKEMLTTAFKNIERPELPVSAQQLQPNIHQTNHNNNQSIELEKQTTAETQTTTTTNHVKTTNSNQRTVRFMDMVPTLNPKFDEKFYVANDVKLKEQKKYDEMEFEEFEVFDPTRTEFCDSLN